MKKLKNNLISKIDDEISYRQKCEYEYTDYIDFFKKTLDTIKASEEDTIYRYTENFFFKILGNIIVANKSDFDESIYDCDKYTELKDDMKFASTSDFTKVSNFIHKLDMDQYNNFIEFLKFIIELIETDVDKNTIDENEKFISNISMEDELKLAVEVKTFIILRKVLNNTMKDNPTCEFVTDSYEKFLVILRYIDDKKLSYEYYQIAFMLFMNFKTLKKSNDFAYIIHNLSKESFCAMNDMKEFIYRVVVSDSKKSFKAYAQSKTSKAKLLIKKRLNILLEENNTFKNDKTKILNVLSDLKEKVSKEWSDSKYIYLKDFPFKYVFDTPIQDLLFKYIFKHNQKIYRELYEENKKNDLKGLNNLDKISIKYSLPYSFSKSIIDANLDLREIELIIDALKNKGLDNILNNRESLEFILLKSNSKIVTSIIKILKDFGIPNSFLENHLEILVPETVNIKDNIYGTYDVFKRNIYLLRERGVQVSDYEIYLGDSIKILESFRLVESLNINLRKRSNNNDQFLKDTKTFDYFDMFIEQGYYELIRNNLPLCDKKYLNVIKRINVAEKVGIDVVDGKTFNKAVLTGNGFLIEDGLLDEYVNNFVPNVINSKYRECLDNNENIDIDLFNELDIIEEYKMNSVEYNINGVIISRFKVIRCFNALRKAFPLDYFRDLLFNAIIYNSYLSVDKVSSIYETIYNKRLLLNM